MEIEFKKVSLTYNDKTPIKKTALRDVNIKIKEANITGIIGKSGSGKSTMAQLMNALLVPTKGSVKVDEFIISPKMTIKNINALRNKVGLIFQFPEEQFFNLTVRQELEFGIKNFQYRVKEIDKRVKDALKMIGLDNSYLEKDPFKLSSGEKRKIAIASILVFNPKVLILDEPTVGLDSKSKENLIYLLKLLKKRYGKTIIIITHDIDVLNKLADYVIILNKGEIALEGNKMDVFSNFDAMKLYGINVPKVMEFSYKVLEKKGIKMGYRDDINDLMKDIYRHVK